MVNNWGLWGQDFAINSNGSIFHHRREIKIAHRQGERSQAECLKQIMVDISAAVLLRLWVQRSRTQVAPTLNVQNVTQHRAVQDSFFADDVVLRHVMKPAPPHAHCSVLTFLDSVLPPPSFIHRLSPRDGLFFLFISHSASSLHYRRGGGRRKEGWKESIWWLFHPPCCSASNINNHFELFTNCRSALRRLEWAVTRRHKRMCLLTLVAHAGFYQAIQSRDHLTGQNTWMRLNN